MLSSIKKKKQLKKKKTTKKPAPESERIAINMFMQLRPQAKKKNIHIFNPS